jgi:hypothetical protein
MSLAGIRPIFALYEPPHKQTLPCGRGVLFLGFQVGHELFFNRP